MYVPKHFEVTDVKVIHDLIRNYPLATIVTLSTNGLNANHIPLHLSVLPEPYGTLQGHVARSNPILDDINTGQETLAIFHGPNTYITPSWYQTKNESGKVVPTWNYIVVHAYGNLRIIDNPEWLHAQLEALTAQNEAQFPEPWAVTDAPVEFTEKLFESIVGIEMKITKLVGKWKVSQNQPPQNRESVIDGLNKDKQLGASKMAELVKESHKII
jgi:transcriptional regulator